MNKILFLLIPIFTTACSTNNYTTLRVGILNKPFSLQSWKIRDGASTIIGNQIHRQLVKFDPQTATIVPDIATNWKIEPKQIIFEIAGDRKLSNGSSIDCNLVKSSFQRLTNAKTETTIKLPKDISFECKNNITFIVKLKEIPAQFFDIIASPIAGITDDSGLIGAGPYKVISSNENKITLSRVYGSGPNTLEFIIGNENEILELFNDGKIDDLMYLGIYKDISNSKCKIVSGISPTVFWFGINSEKSVFVNLENRLLIQKILYLGSIKTEIFKNENRVEGLMPFGVGAIRGIANIKNFSNDLNLSIKNAEIMSKKFGKISLDLREINKDAFNWEFFINTIDPNKKIFTLNFLSNEVFFNKYYKKEMDTFFIGANITRNDPFEVLSYFRKNDFINPSAVKDPFVDNLAEKSAVAKTSKEVQDLSKIAADWVVKNGYALPLFSKNFKGCISQNLEGYQLSPLGPLSIDYSSVTIK